jgi:uncharacterized protein YcnI
VAGSASVAAAALLALPSSVGAFATIPEERVITREGPRDLVHVRVHEGCEGVATDRVEVDIPESVVGVIPQEVPGWTATTETVATESYELFGQELTERVAHVTWTGGPLAPDAFLDFGITAVFTEPDDELVFPVVQGCGDTEQVWDEVPDEGETRSDLRFPAPVVAVVEPPTAIDALETELAALRAEIDAFRTDHEDLRHGEVGGTRLRDRLSAVERRLERAEDRLDEAEQS